MSADTLPSVRCHQCGTTLTIMATDRTWLGRTQLRVSPCESCVGQAVGEGFERGFQEGHHVGLSLEFV